MSPTNKNLQNKPPEYVKCDDCSMQSVCLPLSNQQHTLDLTSHYLSRRVPTDLIQQATELNESTEGELFQQGQKLTDIFAVCAGVFKLYTNNDSGKQQILGFRFPGELIAEDGIFLDEYNYNAAAISGGSVCRVSIEQLNACGKFAPELQTNLVKLLTKQSYQQLRNNQSLIGKHSSEALLAAFLLNIYERNSHNLKDDKTLDLLMSRNDIASYLGIRRETLSRLFAKFQQTELIILEGKKLQLLSINNLEKLVNQ